MYYKYSCICASENNKTLEMARQMKVGLSSVVQQTDGVDFDASPSAKKSLLFQRYEPAQISLMTEEEEALQAASKKIYRALAVSGATLCCACALETLLD